MYNYVLKSEQEIYVLKGEKQVGKMKVSFVDDNACLSSIEINDGSFVEMSVKDYFDMTTDICKGVRKLFSDKGREVNKVLIGSFARVEEIDKTFEEVNAKFIGKEPVKVASMR